MTFVLFLNSHFHVCPMLIFHAYREISKPLIPLGKAGVLLVHILTLLCKGMVRSNQLSIFSYIISNKLYFYIYLSLNIFENRLSIIIFEFNHFSTDLFALKTCRT